MPTYPFERQRYWVESKPAQAVAALAGKRSGHPLLGERFEVAGESETFVWQNAISTKTLPYLADHRAFGVAVFPLTGYLELMTAALAASSLGEMCLGDVMVSEPLLLKPEDPATVQTVLRGNTIEVYSRNQDRWKLHAKAELRPAGQTGSVDTIEHLKERMPRSVSRGDFYAFVGSRGMDFGPSFRTLHELWSSDTESLGHIQEPNDHEGASSGYGMHPAVLDGCFQAVATILPNDSERLYLPVRIASFTLHRKAAGEVWTQVTLRPGTGPLASFVRCDVKVFDHTGLLAEAEGLELQAASRQSLLRSLQIEEKQPYFEPRWEIQPAGMAPQAVTGKWFLFADATGVAERLAAQLRDGGAHCTVAYETEDWKSLLAESAWEGVVHLRSLDAPRTDELTVDSLQTSQRAGCGSLLDLTQCLLAGAQTAPPRLWLVTRNAQPVLPEQNDIQIAQAPIWGFAKAIWEENPEWRCTCVDIQNSPAQVSAELIFREIATATTEEQVAFREGSRYVCRLATQELGNRLRCAAAFDNF